MTGQDGAALVRVTMDEGALDRLRHGATVVRTEPAVFRIEGPGAVPCLQGLLTNDVDKPGPGSLVYGAMLTPKGMIVVDLWVLHEADGFTVVADPAGHDAAMDLFRRSLPPRLARVTDLTGAWQALWMLGAGSSAQLAAAGLGEWPGAGLASTRTAGGGRFVVAGGTAPAWFRTLIAAPAGVVGEVLGNLRATGVVEGSTDDLEAARILAGWPRLGAEIGDKTLPQEVRYDEIGGVSYTKGCYTGQETVARVHFRGHPNRELRGLAWAVGPRPEGDAVRWGEKGEVGTVRSLLAVGGRHLGLAILRRELTPGQLVSAGGQPAEVVALPFTRDEPAS